MTERDKKMETKNSEVDLLRSRVEMLERKLEEKSKEKASLISSIKSSISNFFSRIFTKDNIGIILSFISLVMSSAVAAYILVR